MRHRSAGGTPHDTMLSLRIRSPRRSPRATLRVFEVPSLKRLWTDVPVSPVVAWRFSPASFCPADSERPALSLRVVTRAMISPLTRAAPYLLPPSEAAPTPGPVPHDT